MHLIGASRAAVEKLLSAKKNAAAYFQQRTTAIDCLFFRFCDSTQNSANNQPCQQYRQACVAANTGLEIITADHPGQQEEDNSHGKPNHVANRQSEQVRAFGNMNIVQVNGVHKSLLYRIRKTY
jgi:hypothetical protein